jgi:hypothetical protein
MISRKTVLLLFLFICGFTAIYLYYVKQERQASIIRYFPHPQIGDVYKMQKETKEDGVIVFYLKIKDIGNESIYFYGSKLLMGAIHDSFLKQFDTSEVKVYTKKELGEIREGQWMIPAKDNTKLLEIERK